MDACGYSLADLSARRQRLQIPFVCLSFVLNNVPMIYLPGSFRLFGFVLTSQQRSLWQTLVMQ